MRICLFLICLTCLQQLVFAQGRINYDTARFTERRFSAVQMDRYRSDPDFRYDLIQEPPHSVWDRFWVWFWKKLGEILKIRNGTRILNATFILVAIAILLFFIFKISGMNNIGLFAKKNTGEGLSHSVLDDDVHTINFDIAIQQAIEGGNYRFAIRLLYLQSLKNLTDRQLINWQINKTNFAYVSELNGKACQQPFNELTSQFEMNWYGERPLEAQEFGRVKDQFDLFNRQLPTL
ncbi:MAG: DUF4129 domain-containing protein [Chitinophagaceae bacterium]